METEALLDAWKLFLSAESDEKQLRDKMVSTLNKLGSLKLVQRLQGETQTWEVRKILKARLPLKELDNLRDRLLAAEKS